jgi:hypothetical protein
MEHFVNYANSELGTHYTQERITVLLNSTQTTNADIVEVQNLYAIWRTLPQKGRRYYERIAAIPEPIGRLPARKSPYVLFAYDHRDRIKQEYANTLSFGELGMKLGELWANLPEFGSMDY